MKRIRAIHETVVSIFAGELRDNLQLELDRRKAGVLTVLWYGCRNGRGAYHSALARTSHQGDVGESSRFSMHGGRQLRLRLASHIVFQAHSLLQPLATAHHSQLGIRAEAGEFKRPPTEVTIKADRDFNVAGELLS